MWWFSTIQTLLHWYSFDYFSGSPHYYFRICPLPRSKEPAQAEIFVIRAWMNILSWWMRRTAQKPDTYFYRRCFDSCVWPNKSIMIRFRPPAFLVFEYNGLHSVWKSPLKKYHFATLHLLMQIVIFGAKIQSFEKRVLFFQNATFLVIFKHSLLPTLFLHLFFAFFNNWLLREPTRHLFIPS